MRTGSSRLFRSLGLSSDDLLLYAAREETRHEHLADLRGIYNYRSFSGRGARDLREWIMQEAETATSNEDLAQRFVAECRRTHTILPASSTIERLCADALVDAERRIEDRIARRIGPALADHLETLLEDTIDGRITRFVWLRQFEPGGNSAAANRLLDRLEYLQGFDLPANLLAGIPAQRVARLRRQGERYYADGMRDLGRERKLAILAVCASEWRHLLADALIDTHDRIVGRLYATSERLCREMITDEKAAVRATLKSFADIGDALIGAQEGGEDLAHVISSRPGWEDFRALVATASALTNRLSADPLSRVIDGYHRFRLYTPRMLRLLELRGAPVAAPLLAAIMRSPSCGRIQNGTAIFAQSPAATIVFGKSRCCFTSATPFGPLTSGWRGLADSTIPSRSSCPPRPWLKPHV
jgi:hypothetical protein